RRVCKMKTRKQFHVLMVQVMTGKKGEEQLCLGEKFNAARNEMDYSYVAQPEDWKPISENRIFRDIPCETRWVDAVVGTGNAKQVQRKERNYTIFATFTNNMNDEDSEIPNVVWKHGITVTYTIPAGYATEDSTDLLPAVTKTVLFKRALRSSSQYRTGKMLMAPANQVMNVRMVASYGWLQTLEGKEVNVAKIEPYISTSLTSSLNGGKGWTFEAYERDAQGNITGKLQDYVTKMPANKMICADTRQPGDIRVVNFADLMGADHMVDAEVTDGQAMGTPRAFARIAMNI